jgi:periplasmic protein TonB
MKLGLVFGLVAAVVVHLVVITFGGILFLHDEKTGGTTQQVDLLSADAAEKEKPKEQPKEPPKEQVETQEEAPPDATEIVKNLEVAPLNAAPALDAASLSAIEAALSGQGAGGGDFGGAANFASGGIIGGTGAGGGANASLEQVFNAADIDQKPRAVYQSAPAYPSDMRGKKVEGVVTLIFVVESTGKVSDLKVESSSNPSFERPAIEAVRRWKFDPGLKAGQAVSCKMRIPIRFQPS